MRINLTLQRLSVEEAMQLLERAIPAAAVEGDPNDIASELLSCGAALYGYIRRDAIPDDTAPSTIEDWLSHMSLKRTKDPPLRIADTKA